ncbi:MAG: tRNA uridine-5-carboxymethylaminomethyl(34) synthesis enzyme MnmG, partial [Bacilli bacterium]|nr:tRNA uridine-5-carboxymethylaminomethyl(34) synthesis enzyme MnmG [Bacilli bacterium]
IQPGMGGELAFSFDTEVFTPLEEQLPCWLIYTTPETHKIIEDHLQESAVFNGVITGIGPRYCPSIESKVVRFADKERHQLFLEPEYEDGNSIYLQGFSTGFCHELQEELVHTLPGLEHAKILKYAYQIEYDAVEALEFLPTLQMKKYEGLYGAGQICGTSGYEEAAGLGLVAGVNAARYIKGESPFILGRDEAYIGVMIDDLVSKGTDEPYRLLSSRAEFRLLLRHDNADLRLSEKGHEIGLLSDRRYQKFLDKYKNIEDLLGILANNNVDDKEEIAKVILEAGYTDTDVGHKGIDLLRRPRMKYRDIARCMSQLKDRPIDDASVLSLETRVKYEGYIQKEAKDAEAMRKMEGLKLPKEIDYLNMDGLRLEARQKLQAVMPLTIAQASRIPGVNPADISILILTLKKRNLV